MNAPVYNDEFAFVGGDHEGIVAAAQGAGAATVVTSATFALPELNHSRKMQTIEIDLTAVDYSGNVYVAWDTPAGSFMAITSVEFVA